MNLSPLIPFLELTKVSSHEPISKLAAGVIGRITSQPAPVPPTSPLAQTNEQAEQAGEDEVEPVPTSPDKMNMEGRIMEQGFNDLKDDAPAEKVASAYIKDVAFKDLPKTVQKEVERFAKCRADTKFIHYGMVVSELLSRVDPHNFAIAKDHLKKEKVDKSALYDKAKTKYILIVNESVVDGHHFIAACDKAGLTSSLNVLDLSPARFQKVSVTVWDSLKEKLAVSSKVVSPHKTSLNTFHNVSFEVNSYGLSSVVKVVEYLRWCGSVGHSCDLQDEGKTVGGIDGDGSDRIQNITVDGKPYKADVKG
jgi:hypothetical protein